MKRHLVWIFVVVVFTTGCWSETYFDEEFKKAFPVNYYEIGDTLTLSLAINSEDTDTLVLMVKLNQFELSYSNSGVIIRREHYEEQYNLEACSGDGTKNFHLNAGTYYNDTAYLNYRFSNYGLAKLLLFSKKLDTVTIDEQYYENVYLFGDDAAESNYFYISRQDGIIKIVSDSIVLTPIISQ